MQRKWYGDKRDIVKWSVLLTVARQQHIDKLIQVAYLRDNTRDSFYIEKNEAKAEHVIRREVISHFRNIFGIERISTQGLKIEFFGEHLVRRADYQKKLLDRLIHEQQRIVLFLDPDIGLQPLKSKATLAHVLKTELKEIWGHVKPSGMLVFYQHAKHDKQWIKESKRRICECLEIDTNEISVGYGPGIAKDVVLFIINKTPR
jgi:hypothetical protein